MEKAKTIFSIAHSVGLWSNVETRRQSGNYTNNVFSTFLLSRHSKKNKRATFLENVFRKQKGNS